MSPVVLSTAAENEHLRSALDERNAKLLERDAKLVERDAKNQALRAQVITQREEIKALKKDLRLLTSELEKFIGKRRGDGHLIDDGQLSLFGDVGPQEPEREETPEQAKEAPDGETPEDKIRNRHKPKRPARRIDMSLLARTVVVHELEESQRICPETGVLLVPIGERVFEELDFIGATLQVVEHRQIEYGPSAEVAKERHIDSVVAPLPPRPLEGCRASAALLAHMLILKYMLHMPLYRQETVFKQAGLSIPRQTLCDWVLKAAFALGPIARAIEASIRAGPVLQLDDTPVKCQAGKGQGNFQAYLWTFVNPDIPGVAFRFTEGRSTKDIAPLLTGAEAAILLGDAYAGNKSAAREAGLDVRHAGCWAHVVRKFKDACKEAPSMVGLFRGDLKALYNVEDEALDLGLDAEQRAKLRREKARPIIARLLRRTLGWKETFSLSGSMAAAIKYLRNSRRALTTYLDDGGVPIDNNACERSIRPVAIGRRNWLFAGSVRGGAAAAVVYSLVESCKVSDVDPEAYLTDVLVRVATHPAADVEELVPSRWAAARAAKA